MGYVPEPVAPLSRRARRQRGRAAQERPRRAAHGKTHRAAQGDPGRAAQENTGRAALRRRRRAAHRRRTTGWAVAAVVAVGAAAAVGAVLGGAFVAPDPGIDAIAMAEGVPSPRVTAIPAPQVSAVPVSPVCEDPRVREALATGSDADVIAAFGGAAAFRTAVADGGAACIDLAEATRVWVVVDKHRPIEPRDYWPTPRGRAEGVQRTADVYLRVDAAAALTAMADAAVAEGPGAIGLNSGFRSYDSQVRTYDGYVRALGRDGADRTSARPGYSEHQLGLAADVVACGAGCAGIESFGPTAQAQWVAENAWRFGFIVRYEAGREAITGYEAEPWHLRYLGPDLAAAYHDGGYHTLEEFFGLEPAPDYLE